MFGRINKARQKKRKILEMQDRRLTLAGTAARASERTVRSLSGPAPLWCRRRSPDAIYHHQKSTESFGKHHRPSRAEQGKNRRKMRKLRPRCRLYNSKARDEQTRAHRNSEEHQPPKYQSIATRNTPIKMRRYRKAASAAYGTEKRQLKTSRAPHPRKGHRQRTVRKARRMQHVQQSRHRHATFKRRANGTGGEKARAPNNPSQKRLAKSKH